MDPFNRKDETVDEFDDTVEVEGPNEKEALSRACDALNTVVENLGYEVIGGNKSKGFVGRLLGGGKTVKIRAWRKDERGEEIVTEQAEYAKEALTGIMKHLSDNFTISAIDKGDELHLLIDSDEGGLVIGKNGQNLDAIQFIVRRMVGKQQSGDNKKIVVNTEGYRERREQALVQLAKDSAANVRKNNRRQTLRPMSSYERRIVHMVLKEEKGVESRSQGEGSRRCIVVHPKSKDGNKRSREENGNVAATDKAEPGNEAIA